MSINTNGDWLPPQRTIYSNQVVKNPRWDTLLTLSIWMVIIGLLLWRTGVIVI